MEILKKILDIFYSKRFRAAFAGALAVGVVYYIPAFEGYETYLAEGILIVTGMLISGYTLTDGLEKVARVIVQIIRLMLIEKLKTEQGRQELINSIKKAIDRGEELTGIDIPDNLEDKADDILLELVEQIGNTPS